MHLVVFPAALDTALVAVRRPWLHLGTLSASNILLLCHILRLFASCVPLCYSVSLTLSVCLDLSRLASGSTDSCFAADQREGRMHSRGPWGAGSTDYFSSTFRTAPASARDARSIAGHRAT